jgi:ABC-type multidrug transport system fused ATPase/permease subunit
MITQDRNIPGHDEKLGASDNVSVHLENPEVARSWRRWMRNPLKKKQPPPVPTERPFSKEESASWLSQCFFIWMNSLMTVGYNRPLELTDFPVLNKERRSGPLSEKITKDFKRRVARGDKNALLFAVNKVFFLEFWFGGLCLFFANAVMTVSPIMLKYLIVYAGDAYYKNSAPMGKGVGLAIGLIAMQVAASLSMNQFLYRGMICGGMTRASLISMIYAKSQIISSRAKAGGPKELKMPEEVHRNGNTPKEKERPSKRAEDTQNGWSNGQITNLMSTDTYRIDQAAGWCHLIWVTPIQIIVTLIELIINIGVSALAGFGLFLVATPILALIIKVMAKRRRRVSKITDSRVNLIEEILTGVRFVKYFAWETSFLSRLKQLRAREIRGIQFLLGIRNALNGITVVCPSLLVFSRYLRYLYFSKLFTSKIRSTILKFGTEICFIWQALIDFGKLTS